MGSTALGPLKVSSPNPSIREMGKLRFREEVCLGWFMIESLTHFPGATPIVPFLLGAFKAGVVAN